MSGIPASKAKLVRNVCRFVNRDGALLLGISNNTFIRLEKQRQRQQKSNIHTTSPYSYRQNPLSPPFLLSRPIYTKPTIPFPSLTRTVTTTTTTTTTTKMSTTTIPETMRAAVIHVAGGPEVLKLETRPVPVPKEDEVLIQIKAFGLYDSYSSFL
jgi:hypothetical protein